MTRVLVVGGGIAGTAAALAARSAGARVTVVLGRPGATSLASGALHGPPLTEDDSALLATLGGVILPGAPAHLLSPAGVLRPARGYDEALFDIAPLRGEVAVVAGEHRAWHGEALIRGWTAHAEAKSIDVAFRTLPVSLLESPGEELASDAELAAAHDDDARWERAVGRLQDALRSHTFAGLCVPPWLGLRARRGVALREALGLPCGEPMSLPGGPAGLRFEARRDAAFAAHGIDALPGEVRRVRLHEGWVVAELAGATLAHADAVVLCTGGLLGGLAYNSTAGEAARAPFRLTYDAPVTLGVWGAPLGATASLFGAPPEALAPGGPLDLRAAGILAEGAAGDAVGAPGVYVAGDAREGQPRTWLEAFAAGCRAGRAAARAPRHEARPSQGPPGC